MAEDGIEMTAARELTEVLQRQLNGGDMNAVMSMAVSGAFQAIICHCRDIAWREIMKQKLGVSERDIELALAKAYRDEAQRRRGKGAIQVASEIPAAIRSNGQA